LEEDVEDEDDVVEEEEVEEEEVRALLVAVDGRLNTLPVSFWNSLSVSGSIEPMILGNTSMMITVNSRRMIIGFFNILMIWNGSRFSK